jgi:hypothetical protein
MYSCGKRGPTEFKPQVCALRMKVAKTTALRKISLRACIWREFVSESWASYIDLPSKTTLFELLGRRLGRFMVVRGRVADDGNLFRVVNTGRGHTAGSYSPMGTNIVTKVGLANCLKEPAAHPFGRRHNLLRERHARAAARKSVVRAHRLPGNKVGKSGYFDLPR